MAAVLLAFLAAGGVGAGQTAPPAAAGEISGIVKSGNVPLPGATVTAANTLTGQKVATTSDLDGSFHLRVPGNGRWVVRAQMAAFAPATQEVLINAGNRSARAELEMVLLSRAQTSEQQQRQAMAAMAGAMGGGGVQSLSVMQAEGGAAAAGNNDQVVPPGMPVPGMAPDSPTESVAISGNASSRDFGTMSSEEMRQRIQDAREQQQRNWPGGGGGPAGGRGPGGGGGPMIFLGGRGGRFDINRPHGMVYYTLGDSALDAAPYSLTGEPVTKPSYMQNRFGASLGGPLNIPRIYQGGQKTFFFVNYNGSRSENPFDAFSTVPTDAERNGIFTGLAPIYDPCTHQPFPNNTIPLNAINPCTGQAYASPAAQALLKFIPEPNLPGSAQNFHFLTSATSNSDDFNFRLIHALGSSTIGPRRGGRGGRNNLNIGFHYHSTGTTLTNPFPSVGGNTAVRSFDIPVGYVRSFGKLTNILRADFNRNRISTQNLYAFVQDVAGLAGVSGVSQNPFDWGVPNLSFTNSGSLRDINPLLRRDQTFSISDFMLWNHGKHTLRWGGDFRRIQLNTQTDSNARGSFTFTGVNTAQFVGGIPVSGTGLDFADFLLGLPQMTSVQFGDNNYHFRGNSWDVFAQDEWRVRGNLTLNLGLRYEYVSPYTEINNLIVNLDVAPGFTAAAPVQPGQAGPYTGVFPASLVNPDRNNFAPRVGIVWKPLSKTVVRAGYGINYNTGAYGGVVQQLAFQPPFSITQTNVESASLPLTLENGFPLSPATVTNNYGVDRNYRLGYVQIWNLDIQRELRPDLVLNLDYTGTKGTRLDIVEAPNRDINGVRIAGVQPFLWETSDGSSVAHAGTVRLRKRLQHGFSAGGSYTFSKSIDNASTIGGGAVVVAQNAFDLAAERGLSSFDQRHRFTGDYLWELPFGHDKTWLSGKGALRDIFGDWQWSGEWTVASGLPFTPRVLGSFADVNRGTNGTLRANVTGQPVGVPNPTVAEWFNTGAFCEPGVGTCPATVFGDAGRNTISGPGSVVFNMALTKLIPLGESRMLEVRAQAANIFNTPQFTAIDTVVNSPTYGRVISTGPMRTLQIVTRFRF